MFENIDINIADLPTVDSNSFNSLEKNYRAVLIIKAIIFSIVLIAGYFLFYYYKSDKLPLFVSLSLFVLLAFIVISNFLVAILGFKKKMYKIRFHDLIYKTGLLWKSETSIPFVRVQHSEVIQGPIERIFGIAKLKLYTAGGSTSDLSIPGLSMQKAEELKEFIVKRVQEEEE